MTPTPTPTPTQLSTSTLVPTLVFTETQVVIPTALLTNTLSSSSDSPSKAINPMVGVIVIGIGVVFLIVTGLLVFIRPGNKR